MRIILEVPDCSSSPAPGIRTFHDADAAIAYMGWLMQFDPTASVILTREAAEQLLGRHYPRLDVLSFQLMREIHLMDDDHTDDEEADAGTLNFTSVEHGDIDTIHDDLPCGAEIREFVRQYECWQLWAK